MRRAVLAVVALAVTTAAGCSDRSEPTAPSEAPASSAAATPAPSAGDSASPAGPGSSAGGAPVTLASSCLTGRYQLARFVSVGANNTYGTGQGGDVTVAFDGGRYIMTGAGKKPITATLAGQSAPLTVDGTVDGTYRGTGEEATFTRGTATGSATVTSGGAKRNLTMAQISSVLAPNGSGKLACTSEQLTITLDNVRLELTK